MRRSIRAAIVVAVSVIALAPSPGLAQTGPSEIEQLKQELRRMQERLQKLEQQQQTVPATAPPPGAAAAGARRRSDRGVLRRLRQLQLADPDGAGVRRQHYGVVRAGAHRLPLRF